MCINCIEFSPNKNLAPCGEDVWTHYRVLGSNLITVKHFLRCYGLSLSLAFAGDTKSFKQNLTFLLTLFKEYCKITSDGRLAQLGEHLFDVQKVIGSIPIAPTILKKCLVARLFF